MFNYKQILQENIINYPLAAFLFLCMLVMICSSIYAYEEAFTYNESDLPFVFKNLPSSNDYSTYVKSMAEERWNLYADLFEVESTTEDYVPDYNNGVNDQAGFMNDEEFNDYFETSG